MALLGLLTDDSGLYRQGAYAGATIQPVSDAMESAWQDLEGHGVDAIIPLTHQVDRALLFRDVFHEQEAVVFVCQFEASIV